MHRLVTPTLSSTTIQQDTAIIAALVYHDTENTSRTVLRRRARRPRDAVAPAQIVLVQHGVYQKHKESARHRGDEAGPACEEVAFEEIQTHEVYRRIEQQYPRIGALALGDLVGHGGAGVAVELVHFDADIGFTVVIEGRLETREPALQLRRFVHGVSAHAAFGFVEQPQKIIHAGREMTHAPEYLFLPGHLVAVGARSRGEQRADFLLQYGRQRLIGIEQQHPAMAGEIQRHLFLLAVTEEGVLTEAAMIAVGDGGGAVAAERIQHHDLIGPAHRIETRAERAFAVEAGDAYREYFHRGPRADHAHSCLKWPRPYHAIFPRRAARSCQPCAPGRVLARHSPRRAAWTRAPR